MDPLTHINSLEYHESVKSEEHVFIFSVAGRSSSTAFQRILNSSNELCIWGESHGHIEQISNLSHSLEDFNNECFVNDSLNMLHDSFKQNRHDLFYANAIGNLENTQNIVKSSVSILLKPWQSVNRFGFKDITVDKLQTLEFLSVLYPASKFIFCFRDPIEQWPSVSKVGWWPYCKTIDLFLEEYLRLSDIYLNFGETKGYISFIHNINLLELYKVKQLLKYLNVTKIDETLINRIVGSTYPPIISERDKRRIYESAAYERFCRMRRKSDLFFSTFDAAA